MKPSLTGVASALLFAHASLSAAGWEAGAAKVDITPEGPIRLSGYGGRTAPSEGIDDRIHARVLVLRAADGAPTALVAVDAIGIPAALREEVVGEIRGRTGIYHVRIAVAATHTHYAPCLARSIPNLLAMTPEEIEVVKAYTDSVQTRIIEGIDAALGRLSPATVEYGKGTCGFAKNRRTPGGPVDQSVPVLRVTGADGKPIAVVFGYACHATTIPPEVNRVSADWPGLAASLIEDANPGAVALPLIGCGADANPEPRSEVAHAKAHARSLADSVAAVLRGELVKLPPELDAQLESVPLKYAKVPSKADLEAALASGPEHVRRRARLLLDRIASEGTLPETYSYPIQAWAFGKELVMVFLAGEVVVDYAIRLGKEVPAKRLWVAAYTNDIPCYIASRRVLAEGGYEADDSMVWYGQPSRWDPSVEDVIVEKVRALAAGLADPATRVKPPSAKSPEEALKTFEVPTGLRIELAAFEPNVTDPVAIAFDERGRLYAAEMRDYPLGPGEGKPFDGRVRILEDGDGDGIYERSSIFAAEIPYANGIACSQGGDDGLSVGVFVTAVPEVLYLKDTDGDGRADVRKTIYTGFRPGNSQHLVNSLSRGLDNWIHANGGDVASITSPEKPSVPLLGLTGANLRFDPQTLRVEAATGHRGGFGITFTPDGRRFVCDNQSHAVHVVLEWKHLSLNPDLRIDETMEIATDHGARVYPASRTLERFNDPQDYGRFSSACGVHVYTGDALPEKYRGSLFSCEPVSNLVHRDVLEPSGATSRAKRGEEGTEFLRSTDHWFRPVNCATGPDGALYIVDMYREVIEHPQWIPAHIQKYFDLRSGMDRGRIYRVTAAKSPVAGAGRNTPPGDRGVAGNSPAELAAVLSHPNGWRRETAQRLLVERWSGHDAVDPGGAIRDVTAVLAGSGEPLGRLHALWALQGMDGLGPRVLAAALEDKSPVVRASAVAIASQLLTATKGNDGTEALRRLRERLIALADDPDAGVRFQAALSLSAVDPASRAEPLARIAARDAEDRWTATAILASSTGDVTPTVKAVLAAGPISPGREAFVRRACDLAGARKRPDEVAGLVLLLAETEPAEAITWRARSLSALLGALDQDGLARTVPASQPARGKLDGFLGVVADRARDEKAALEDRIAALDLAGHGASAATVPALAAFLDPRYPRDLQASAVRGLAGVDAPAVTSLFIEAFPRLTPRVRSEVLDALLRDTGRTRALLDALERGDVAIVDLDITRRKRLLEAGSDEDRRRAERILAAVAADPDRVAVVEKYRGAFAAPSLAGAGDRDHGKDLFLKKCSICHRAGDQGTAVGADLSGMRAREVDALLADILDPSRAVAPEFVNYVLVTTGEEIVTGVLALETPVNVVIRGPEGKTRSVLRRDIKDLRATTKSVMPDGFEKELPPADLRDVIAFIKSGL